MSDSKSDTALDRKLISLKAPYEVRDWCKSLNCTPDQLGEAVRAVGHSVEAVRRYLADRK